MTIKLKINGPTGRETILTLCDNEEDMKNITGKQLKKKIRQELGIGTILYALCIIEAISI